MEGNELDNSIHAIKVKRERSESTSSQSKSDANGVDDAPVPKVKAEKKRKRDMFSKLYFESLRRKASEDAAALQSLDENAIEGSVSALPLTLDANHFDPNNPRRKVYIIPRILKTDIRRQYASMFANVYNSQDVELMEQFLTTYFRKDFIYSQTGRHYMDLQHAKICTIQDFKAVSEFWYEHMLDTPDLVFKLGKVQFKLKSDNTGTVTFQCSITGTRCSLEDRYQQELALFAKYNVQEIIVDANVSEFVIDPFDTPISQPDRSLIPFVHQYPHSIEGSDIELSPYAFQGLLTLHLDGCSKIFSSNFQLINFAPLPWDAV